MVLNGQTLQKLDQPMADRESMRFMTVLIRVAAACMYAIIEARFIVDLWRLHNLHASSEYILTATAFQSSFLVSFVCFLLQTKPSPRLPTSDATWQGSFLLTCLAVICLLLSLMMDRSLAIALVEARHAFTR